MPLPRIIVLMLSLPGSMTGIGLKGLLFISGQLIRMPVAPVMQHTLYKINLRKALSPFGMIPLM